MPLSPQQNQLLARIREILNRTDTIVFVGSGISRWSGLPSWYGLIDELAYYVDAQGLSAEIIRKELNANDLLQAASYGVDLLTKSQFAEFIRLGCRVETAVPHEIHKEIISLGPSCFVTTNYDQLVEYSFSKWQPDRRPRVVTNNQLTEIATIIQARSSNFIFKPHGDINDSESIILTREHYRKLNGEKQSVLRALETLLASRPVVFLGFGLRDLDFLYVKEILANIYKGGTIDHYAIMPDVSEQERTYWRKNFGIHILSYVTSSESGHQQLLDILQQLNESVRENAEKIDTNKNLTVGFTPERILAIARYSANIVHSINIQDESHIPLRISRKRENKFDRTINRQEPFADSEVEHFLEEYPHNALLIGSPGSGKSYSLRRVLYKLAQNVQRACLQKNLDIAKIDFPIYLDLKLYEGDIFEMIDQILPPDFSLSDLSGFNHIKIFLDSYNELPNLYSDSGKFQNDFNRLLATFNNLSTIIASRFAEGLSNLNFPVYQVESIDYSFIENQLTKLNLQLPDKFRREIIDLFQKPLFYQLYQEQNFSLSSEMTPIDIYRSFIQRISSELGEFLGVNVSLEDMFKLLAYRLINDGVETFSLDDLEMAISESFSKGNFADKNIVEVINWLISKNFLIPASKLRLSFFHQSITEYLAALELAQTYQKEPAIIDTALKFTRWDQCLYLVTNFLDAKLVSQFIHKIMDADLVTAMQAVKYLDHNSDEIVFHILSKINDVKYDDDLDHRLIFWLDELPVTEFHKEIVDELLNAKNLVGGVAAKLLVDIRGVSAKPTLINELFSQKDNFNYCMHVGRSLSKIIEIGDFQDLFGQLDKLEIDSASDDSISGLLHGLAETSENLRGAELIEFFQNWRDYNVAQISLACNVLGKIDDDSRSLSLLVEMTRFGVKAAIIPLHFKITRNNQKSDGSLFSLELVDALIASLNDIDGYWAVSCLDSLCKASKDIEQYVEKKANGLTGVQKIALLSCVSETNEFWEELNLFANYTDTDIASEPIHLLEHINVEWAGHEYILVNLLRTNNINLLIHLLNTNFWEKREKDLSINLNVQSIAWWLDWMYNLSSVNENKQYAWFINHRIGELLPKHVNEVSLQKILDEFNNPNSKHRTLIKNYLLHNVAGLSVESFTEESVSFLINDLNNNRPRDSFSIGQVATEQFVEKRLLPLLSNKSEPFNKNLLEAIEIAGRINNRRFLV